MKKRFRSYCFMMFALIALILAIFSLNSKEISASQKVDIFKYYYGDVDDSGKVDNMKTINILLC